MRKLKSCCKRGHELTEKNIYWNNGRRHCRVCRSENSKKINETIDHRGRYRIYAQRSPEKAYMASLRCRLKKLGITVEDYQRMLEAQKCKCASCKKDFSNNSRKLHVDHSHTTGQVRGLLCGRCNSAFGLLEESEEIIRGLINYKNRAENKDCVGSADDIEIYYPTCPSAP